MHMHLHTTNFSSRIIQNNSEAAAIISPNKYTNR